MPLLHARLSSWAHARLSHPSTLARIACRRKPSTPGSRQMHEHLAVSYVFKDRSCIFWTTHQTKISQTGRTYTNALERRQLILVYLHNKSSGYKSSRHFSIGKLSNVKRAFSSLLFQDFDLGKLRDKTTWKYRKDRLCRDTLPHFVTRISFEQE